MGEIISFAVWTIISFLFVGLGVADHFAEKPVGFWANAQTGEMTDIKGYNQAVGKLFIVYGLVLFLLGLPLLAENEAMILLSVLGTMLSTIVVMTVYTIVIEKKYRTK